MSPFHNCHCLTCNSFTHHILQQSMNGENTSKLWFHRHLLQPSLHTEQWLVCFTFCSCRHSPSQQLKGCSCLCSTSAPAWRTFPHACYQSIQFIHTTMCGTKEFFCGLSSDQLLPFDFSSHAQFARQNLLTTGITKI